MNLRESYILQLKKYNQNYRSRLALSAQSKEVPIWTGVFEKLLCLALVVEKNIKSFDDDELREFLALYTIADIIHNPENKSDKKSQIKLLTEMIETSIPLYANIMGISEEQLKEEMKKNLKIIGLTQISYEKKQGGIIKNRRLKLRQYSETIEETTEKTEEDELRELEQEKIMNESKLKKQLAENLKRGYKNIKIFEDNFEKYRDYRKNLKDIKYCFNPIIRSQRIQVMEEHLTKLTRFHHTITDLYNELYYTLTESDDIQSSDFSQLETVFFYFEQITELLKRTIGDIEVNSMVQRRLTLQEMINKYNDYINQISTGTGDESIHF